MAEKHPHPDDEDDDEYELEPVDPAILERERQRAEERTREAGAKVDVERVLQETESSDPMTFDDLRGFRFTIRHLMIATAVLAIFLSLVKVADCLGLFIAALVALGAGWYFVLRKERRERRERERRLAELDLPLGAKPPVEAEIAVAQDQPTFHVAFSLKQVFAAMTVAAVALGLVEVLGTPEQAALLLGTVALLGLGIYLIGFEAPPLVILGWWLLLVLYIAVSLWAAFASTLGAPGP